MVSASGSPPVRLGSPSSPGQGAVQGTEAIPCDAKGTSPTRPYDALLPQPSHYGIPTPPAPPVDEDMAGTSALEERGAVSGSHHGTVSAGPKKPPGGSGSGAGEAAGAVARYLDHKVARYVDAKRALDQKRTTTPTPPPPSPPPPTLASETSAGVGVRDMVVVAAEREQDGAKSLSEEEVPESGEVPLAAIVAEQDSSDEERHSAYTDPGPRPPVVSKLAAKLMPHRAKPPPKRRGASFAVLYNVNKQPEWGQDVRRAMEARGLREVTAAEADIVWGRYVLRADVAPPSSHINRFPGGWGALTTKRGLSHHLVQFHRATKKKLPLDKFWPRCYSLGNADARHHFEKDFQLSEALCLLRKHLLSGKEPAALDPALHAAASLWGAALKEPWNTIVQSAGATGTPLPRAKLKALVKSAGKLARQSGLTGGDERPGHNVWIIKPSSLSRGRGIALFTDLRAIRTYTRSSEREEAEEELMEDRPWEDRLSMKCKAWVAQKYIERPLIVQRKKFDIRQWVLVTSIHPLKVWFYDDCYLRFCSVNYDPDDLSQPFAHLTNNSVQKHASTLGSPRETEEEEEEAEVIDGNMWHSREFRQHLLNTHGYDAWVETVQPQMKRATVLAMKACQSGFKNVRPNSFEVFGLDFMIDEDLGVWLLEANLTPDMSHSTQVTAELVSQMVEDTAKVILDCRDTGMRLPRDEEESTTDEDDDDDDEDDDSSSSDDDSGEKEDGYCSFDEDFEYSPPKDTGAWICIHRGKSQSWNFADFLAREGAYADRKKSRRQHDVTTDEKVKPLR